MPTINDYNAKSWRIIFYDKNKHPARKAVYFKKKSYYKTVGLTKKQAEKLAWEMEHKHRTGEIDLWSQSNKVDSLRISEAITIWKRKAQRTLAPRTIENRVYELNKFKRKFGDAYLFNIPEAYLNEYVNGAKTLATRTNRRTMINTLLAACRDAGYDIHRSIKVLSSKIERKAASQIDSNQFITKKELFEICEAHNRLIQRSQMAWNLETNQTLTVLFQLLFFTGLRRSDILHLKPSWLSSDFSLLTIGDASYKPKSQKPTETVALLPEAIELFRAHIHLFPISSIAPDHLTKRFKKAVKKVLDEPRRTTIHLHSLRHSFVMYCLDDLQLPERIVKQLTRHEDHRSFAKYTHKNVNSVLQHLQANLQYFDSK